MLEKIKDREMEKLKNAWLGEDERKGGSLLLTLICGLAAIAAGIALAITLYRHFKPKYNKEFNREWDDGFDEDFSEFFDEDIS